MSIRAVDTEASPGNLYQMLPSVNAVLLFEGIEALLRAYPRDAVVHATQKLLDEIREEISRGDHSEKTISVRLATLSAAISNQLKLYARFSTGMSLHKRNRCGASHLTWDAPR